MVRFRNLRFSSWHLAFWGLLAVAGQSAGEPSGLPELVRTSQRVFAIPFRLPKPTTPDAAATRVELHASRDFGLTWSVAGQATPTDSSIAYRADTDGEYWFRIRAIDRENRARGGEGPDLRVLVDAAAPRLAGRVWKGTDGEIICRYAAADDSIAMDAINFAYRLAGGEWKTIAAEPVLARQSPAHLIGEEIWWAGQEVNGLAVRIEVTDAGGHSTSQQFSLLPSDPGVTQADLAREIQAPILPNDPDTPRDTKGRTITSVMVPNPATSPVVSSGKNTDADRRTNSRELTDVAWRADAGKPWSNGGPPTFNSQAGSQLREDAAFATTRGTLAPSEQPIIRVGQPSLAEVLLAETSRQTASHTAEYRGRPLHLLQSRQFRWQYDFVIPADLEGPFRVELWTTQDAGGSWQRTAVDDDTASPITVEFPVEGLYGCRLEIVRDLPGEPLGPRPGDEPASWIGIDETPPQVTQLDVEPVPGGAVGEFLISYHCEDALALPDRVRLSYSPHASGPWATIASAQPTVGSYRWQPHRTLPSRVFVRVEMPDAAGNIGERISAEPVAVRTARFTGTLGSPLALPADGETD